MTTVVRVALVAGPAVPRADVADDEIVRCEVVLTDRPDPRRRHSVDAWLMWASDVLSSRASSVADRDHAADSPAD